MQHSSLRHHARNLALLVALAQSLFAQPQTYIGTLDATSVTIAWGTTSGSGNTIGRGAKSPGKAIVQLGDRRLETTQPFLTITGLTPNTSYTYSVTVNGAMFGQGKITTWPEKTNKLAFFVIGDWGSGDGPQQRLAARMEKERLRLQAEGKPVRFVMSMGDNIYGKFHGSGNKDEHWGAKFFQPYQETLSAIPFYAVLGNHDGNESERHSDLPVYLDNFFFPGGQPARWYHFQIGQFAEFFALDTTRNQPKGEKAPLYLEGGEQSNWLRKEIARPALPWRFIVMHHPPFTAGPEHPPFHSKVPHWMKLFAANGVDAVFSGHEHNFQMTERNQATSAIRFVISGSGGQLRDDDVRAVMTKNQIALWANAYEFCLVELDGDKALLTPFDENGPLSPRDAQGTPHKPPFTL